MYLNFLKVKFDNDEYPSWRGSVDAGKGIVFVDSRFNPEYKYIAMGIKTNDIGEAIKLASDYTINKRNK